MRNSHISWCTHTFNPWWGCVEVSPACDHCYARTLAERFHQGLWGKDAARRPASENTWAEPERWAASALKRGVRERVFCGSMCDVFEDRSDLDRWRSMLWRIVERTGHSLDWLLLTKRPENMAAMVPSSWASAWPRNAWAGTTAENARRLQERMVHLARIPASIRFLSIEPLMGPLSVKPYLGFYRAAHGRVAIECPHGFDACPSCDAGPIHWCIVGGESGRNARPMHPGWVREIRDECATAGTPFHFKQWGEFVPREDHAGHVPEKRLVWVARDGEVRDELQRVDRSKWALMARVGKKAAGSILDGRAWLEIPELVRAMEGAQGSTGR